MLRRSWAEMLSWSSWGRGKGERGGGGQCCKGLPLNNSLLKFPSAVTSTLYTRFPAICQYWSIWARVDTNLCSHDQTSRKIQLCDYWGWQNGVSGSQTVPRIKLLYLNTWASTLTQWVVFLCILQISSPPQRLLRGTRLSCRLVYSICKMLVLHFIKLILANQSLRLDYLILSRNNK